MLARLYNTVSKYRWIEMDQERLCGCELFWGGYYFDSETYGWMWTELMNLFSVIMNSRVYISVKKINRILRCRQVHSTINSSSIHKPQSAIELPGGVTLIYIGYNRCGYVRVGFLRRCGLKTGIHFAHLGVESRMVFEGTTGVCERIYRFNSK